MNLYMRNHAINHLLDVDSYGCIFMYATHRDLTTAPRHIIRMTEPVRAEALQEALKIDELFTMETDCLQRASFEQFLPGLDLYLLRQENGCAALISCEGVRVALTSGSMDFSNMPAVEVFFGGSGKITQLQADTILFSAAPRPHWNNVSAQRKLQGEDIELWLHPDRGWSVKEGNTGVL